MLKLEVLYVASRSLRSDLDMLLAPWPPCSVAAPGNNPDPATRITPHNRRSSLTSTVQPGSVEDGFKPRVGRDYCGRRWTTDTAGGTCSACSLSVWPPYSPDVHRPAPQPGSS